MAIDEVAESPEAVFTDSHTTDRMAMRGPRIRVMTRPDRRRAWPIEQKRAIVAESLAGEMSVSAVARKHDIFPGLLFTWRRQFLAGDLGAVAPMPQFARVDVVTTHHRDKRDLGTDRGETVDGDAATGAGSEHTSGVMEIILGGVTVRVDASVDETALRRVFAALGHRR